MRIENAQKIVPKRGLSTDELEAVMKLAEICNEHDGISLKINSSLLRMRPAHETNDFFYFIDGELVGFLGLYQFNNSEIEISGMVHPNHRLNGIFSALVQEAKREAQQRKISKLIFINEQRSTYGKAFLRNLGANYSFSEYWMKHMQRVEPVLKDPICLRPGAPEDLELSARIRAAAFKMDEAETLESMTKRNLESETRKRMMIDVNGEIIGTLGMDCSLENSAFIYGFCILPELQGRGYGRQALSLAVESALDLGRPQIELEVACENEHALSLYQSCGFEVLRANDYYVQMIDAS